MPGVVSSPFSPSRPAFPALCVAGRPVWVSPILARWYAIPCGLCVPQARSGCPSGPPRVSFVCVCARALAPSAPPHLPPWVGVARAPRAVLVLGAGRAVPRGPCPPACPASVPCSVWLALGAGRPGPVSPYLAWGCALPVGWVQAWGPVTTPSARSCELALRAFGAAPGCPRVGASCLGVGRPGSGALPPPTTRPFRRAAGAHYPLAVGAGGAGVGTRHQPHSARSCELALRAVGTARGAGRGLLAWMGGVRGRKLSHPRPLVYSGVRPGPTTHWLWMQRVQAWEPVNNPTAGALASWLCALWGQHEGARGGAPLDWASGIGRCPIHDRSPFQACGRGPLPTGCGCGGCGRGDPSPTPERLLLRAGFARCGGGTRAPRGGHLLPGCGAPGVGRSPTPDRPSLEGVQSGPTTHWLWVRGVPAWGPVTNPTARALACWLGALWGRHEGARGGRLLPGCGASGVGRSPTPDHSSFRACGRCPLPTGCGCGGCGRGDPSSTPQRALLRGGFARCGGGKRVPERGASCLGVGRLGSGALPPPTSPLLGRAAGAHYPFAVGAGGPGVGTRHQPHSGRFCELALRAVGAARGRPGGRLLTGCGDPGVRRSPTPDRPSFQACDWGPLPTGCGCGGLRAWGPVTNPTARALAGWLCALWGRHEGAQGGRLLPGCGAFWVGRSPRPGHSSFRACGPGPLPTCCVCRGRGCGDPSPTPARALASWLCALWGRREGAQGGRLLPGCGASGVGRSPIPDHSSFRACSRGPLPTGCGCRGCRRGDPSPTPQRALLRASFARCGGGTRARGEASCLDLGCPGSDALPPPTTRLFGHAAGAHYPLAVDAEGAGVGTRHQPHRGRSCELALRAVGAA